MNFWRQYPRKSGRKSYGGIPATKVWSRFSPTRRVSECRAVGGRMTTSELSRRPIARGERDQSFGSGPKDVDEELMMIAHPDLLTVSEAAERLRISTSLTYELIRQERLPHLHL